MVINSLGSWKQSIGSLRFQWEHGSGTGKQVADQAAKRGALHNSDLIGVAALVPQTNLPETPSYTESETLKAKIEGFQEDYMGWFQK